MPDSPRLLAAGWSGRPAFHLAGIQEELVALAHLGATTGVDVRVLWEPSLEELAHVYNSLQPLVLHLVPPAVTRAEGMPAIVISGDSDIHLVSVDHLSTLLAGDQRPRLAVMNTCHCAEGNGGPSAIQVLSERLRTAVIGWRGAIQDLAAVDFARFFYTRLVEGGTVRDALLSYRALQPTRRSNLELATRTLRPISQVNYGPVPMLWTVSHGLLTEPLLGRPREEEQVDVYSQERRTRGGGRRTPTPRGRGETLATQEETASPAVAIQFEPQKWLNPALLKNGRPPLVRLVLSPDRPLRSVGLAITCDTGSGMSTVRQTLDLAQGPQPVSLDAVQFPVLYKLIEDDIPRRQINFTVACSLMGNVLVETTTPVLWMDRCEWLDKPDTWRYIPAFVSPFAEKVLEVIGKAVNVLKTLGNQDSHFSGYLEDGKDLVMMQVEAVFKCLLGKDYELNYIAPPPVAVYTPGDLYASGQRVRVPDEVIARQRGTCHDLSVLLASCLEQIGLYPLIVLIQGHTFVGFWKDADQHEEFWKDARSNMLRQPQDPGREWTIRNVDELQGLVAKDAIAFVEATLVTKRNATFLEAVKEGLANLGQPEWFDVAVDIQASRRFIQPL